MSHHEDTFDHAITWLTRIWMVIVILALIAFAHIIITG